MSIESPEIHGPKNEPTGLSYLTSHLNTVWSQPPEKNIPFYFQSNFTLKTLFVCPWQKELPLKYFLTTQLLLLSMSIIQPFFPAQISQLISLLISMVNICSSASGCTLSKTCTFFLESSTISILASIPSVFPIQSQSLLLHSRLVIGTLFHIGCTKLFKGFLTFITPREPSIKPTTQQLSFQFILAKVRSQAKFYT